MDEAAASSLLLVLTSDLAAVLKRLQSRQSDMDRYRFLMGRVWNCDVRSDADFQRTFNGLYMVRRGAAWRQAFYGLFETYKTASERSFVLAVNALHEATGRIEASFASKLIATLDPTMPVYDSWIRINMRLPARRGPASSRLPALCADYDQICAVYAWITGHPQYRHIRAAFDATLPSLDSLTDVKKIDLLLWQSRPD